MTDVVLRLSDAMRYRWRLAPQFSDVPDHRLVELVEGPDPLTPGRALDIGCGTGRNAVYLAGHGWDTTGVDMVDHALRKARRKAAAQQLAVRFVQGDVTRLADLDIGEVDLLMGGGCYHMIPADRRQAYAESVTGAASAGARLIIVGVRRRVGSPEQLAAGLPGWRLLRASPVPGRQMAEYFSGRSPLRAALNRDAIPVLRYELQRTPG